MMLQVATTMRALLAMPTVTVADQPVLLRSLEVYEEDRLRFAEAQLVAVAEAAESVACSRSTKG